MPLLSTLFYHEDLFSSTGVDHHAHTTSSCPLPPPPVTIFHWGLDESSAGPYIYRKKTVVPRLKKTSFGMFGQVFGGAGSCAEDICAERMKLAKDQAEEEFDETGAATLSHSAEKKVEGTGRLVRRRSYGTGALVRDMI